MRVVVWSCSFFFKIPFIVWSISTTEQDFTFWSFVAPGNFPLERPEKSTLGSRGFFFLSTRLRREPSVSIRKKYPLEPRVRKVLLHLFSNRIFRKLVNGKQLVTSLRLWIIILCRSLIFFGLSGVAIVNDHFVTKSGKKKKKKTFCAKTRPEIKSRFSGSKPQSLSDKIAMEKKHNCPINVCPPTKN